jgi:hypothetical protein
LKIKVCLFLIPFARFHPDYFYQLGIPPLWVDIMMSIPGVEFEEAWKNRAVVELDSLKIPFISRSDLIRAKEASGKPQDKMDIDRLKSVFPHVT